MLTAFAFALPSPSITEEAKAVHMNEGVEDEYAFRFD